MKKKKYHHLTRQERVEIAYLKNKKGYSINAVAEAIGRSKSTISEEISKNSVNGIYAPKKAQHKAYVKRKYSKYQGMKIVQDDKLRDYVEEKIKEDWSPEQVAGRLKEIDKHIKYASREAIYKYIYSAYGRQLEKYLRYKGKRRKGGKSKSASIGNRTFIDQRPEIANNRARFGDWEGDLIVSGRNGKGVLLVLHERKTRFPVIEKIMSRKTSVINDHIYQRTGGFVCFKSLTIDSDVSFQKHQEISKIIGAPVYFCHPYHAWEKGGVENTNKWIRQYVPKGSDISRFSKKYIKEVEVKLQNRPRKCLGYKTPMEVMVGNNQLNLTFFLGKEPLEFKINKNAQVVRLEG
jgi:IS30 family transposase